MHLKSKLSRATIESARYASYIFLIGALAAVIAWIVYVAKWNVNVYNKVASGEKTAYPLSARDQLATSRYTICYMATVATVLFCMVLRHIHHNLSK